MLSLYLDGHSYEAIGERLECDTKTVDNALQRVKRKVSVHLAAREVIALGRTAGSVLDASSVASEHSSREPLWSR